MSRGRRALILIMLAVIGIVATVLSVHIFRRQPQPGPAIAGLASTPPLGWNSWNVFGCNIDEQRIERTAQAMVSSGMRDAGYRYGWSTTAGSIHGATRQGNCARTPPVFLTA
ncbi:Alpha galactosidase precursor [Mycobacteroides abscessus]|nr:Alpha galactosidase precursor [Mycobacteroides abscessus]